MATDPKLQAALTSAYAVASNDCSGFLKKVVSDLGHPLTGTADALVDYFRKNFTRVETIPEVMQLVKQNRFVVAGLKSGEHNPKRANGHVVVIVDGLLYRGKYPKCWGGSIGAAQSQGTKSVGEVWNTRDRDNVQYFVATWN
ncbi:MAG TPA: hypothetical protein VJT73_04065 [Polyangiaceae bacterium]|nr:hypothetical protein [Polyangiaceae bacterium]